MKCTPGRRKAAKRVKNCDGKFVCVRYGDPSMTIKKHIESRKRSFCARHRCASKTDPATPGYQSCKAWDCKTGTQCAGSRRRNGVSRKRRRKSKGSRRRNGGSRKRRQKSKGSRRRNRSSFKTSRRTRAGSRRRNGSRGNLRPRRTHSRRSGSPG